MLRALVDFRYDSKQLKAGDEFEPVKESDAHVLTKVGKAESVTAEQRKRRSAHYRRSDMRAED